MTPKPPENPLSPRKAPLQRRATATVDAIVEAAARILETLGPDGYTTNAVAERAGVSIGSLYQYFPNRDALTVALIERETSTLLEQARQAATEPTCAAALSGLIDAAIAHQMRRPALARVIDFEERRLPLGERNLRVAEQLHRVIVEALGRPDAPAIKDRETAAQDVLALAHGINDVAGERMETDAQSLRERVWIAVRGYLVGMAEIGR
ncbi:TetR family transcriptional regulator [Paraburkholderia acidicola]|uniref:TetR family transcriptional regulator n=1 Tax=Paraburkholderia acidicola TaxID=1912599 RepID=A0A2A4F292_9BURK|nr:TetR/AcrR family transcriptional regulator [Paraburkholderia acidicola]PCE27491.1 TetR family transcriptional regulator [Paraburkholderia acidicola]